MRRLNLSMFLTQLTRVREGELPLQSRKYSAFKTIARAVPNLPTTASWMKSKAMLVIVIVVAGAIVGSLAGLGLLQKLPSPLSQVPAQTILHSQGNSKLLLLRMQSSLVNLRTP